LLALFTVVGPRKVDRRLIIDFQRLQYSRSTKA